MLIETIVAELMAKRSQGGRHMTRCKLVRTKPQGLEVKLEGRSNDLRAHLQH